MKEFHMGFNQFSVFSFVKSNTFLSAVLAGFGIWTKPAPNLAAPKPALTQLTQSHLAPSNIYPLRVIRVKDSNPQMAGRMVISGRMADVCAELDRLAA
jgi:hypothetical protein